MYKHQTLVSLQYVSARDRCHYVLYAQYAPSVDITERNMLKVMEEFGLDIRRLQREANRPPLSIGRLRCVFQYTSFQRMAFLSVVDRLVSCSLKEMFKPVRN